jgi:hypothetical protein
VVGLLGVPSRKGDQCLSLFLAIRAAFDSHRRDAWSKGLPAQNETDDISRARRQALKIRALARATNTSGRSLRYYESELLLSASRDRYGHRSYCDSDVDESYTSKITFGQAVGTSEKSSNCPRSSKPLEQPKRVQSQDGLDRFDSLASSLRSETETEQNIRS